MKNHYEIVIIGAGPAGMAAAITAAKHGAEVLLLDEQPSAGGQIYRALETQSAKDRDILGAEYYAGRSLISDFKKSGVEHVTGATVWQVSPDREIGISKEGIARLITADQVIIATGAQERPFPIPGWTLPGVMTAGGAQVLLKSSGVVVSDAVFVGSGPLLYLVAHQYLKARIPIRAILDTTPKANTRRSLRHLPGMLLNIALLMKGRRWIAELCAADIPFITDIDDLKVGGEEAVVEVEYKRKGNWQKIETSNVFLHQGVVPNINLAMAAGCSHFWNEAQLCWHARTNSWAETDVTGIAIVGDGVSIGGAKAAEYLGRIAGYGALMRSGHLVPSECDRRAGPYRKASRKELRIRPFLDTMFRPARQFRIPADDTTIVCRCEEVPAGLVRSSVALGCRGPNQLKSFSRCGMGPCQGRFCGLTVSEMIADARGVPVAEIDMMRLRSPVKPLLLGELADMSTEPEPSVEEETTP